jgi:hypothetical protein
MAVAAVCGGAFWLLAAWPPQYPRPAWLAGLAVPLLMAHSAAIAWAVGSAAAMSVRAAELWQKAGRLEEQARQARDEAAQREIAALREKVANLEERRNISGPPQSS